MNMVPAGSQNEYYMYQPKTNNSGSQICMVLEDESQHQATFEHVSSDLHSLILDLTILLDPVYVKKSDEGESLVYNSRMMKRGNKYRVTWYGEHFVLIKNESSVDIYKFYPDND